MRSPAKEINGAGNEDPPGALSKRAGGVRLAECPTRGFTIPFVDCSLRPVEEAPNIEKYDFDSDNMAIAAQMEELAAKHPEKREIFQGYVQNQLNECADLENSVMAVTWMLQKYMMHYRPVVRTGR